MLFHTWTFVLFFLIVYPLHLVLKRTRAGIPLLLAASYVFYGWWNPLYLLLILYASAVNYWAVVLMDRTGRRKLWLALSVVNSLGLLGFFKYAGFVTDNLNALLAWAGAAYRLPEPGIILPVGISFFTFQAMSYAIDYYRGEVERERSFVRFATFVALFPQLVAGPIERASNLLPQLHTAPQVSLGNVTDGLSLFVVGLFKKVALADYLALYVQKVYGAPGQFDGPALALATFAFGWQIYFDFSGYTDMARGVARMMGYRLMLNFDNPYLATGLGDFWRRWHVSLSTWFRDYVYIPLGGNRKSRLRTYGNMFLTMVISGLWHGAAWTFVIWGALHAVGRVLTRELERSAFYAERVPKFVKRLFVFGFVTFAWIFFRARTLDDAWLIVSRLFGASWSDPRFPAVALTLVLVVWAYEHVYESGRRYLVEYAPVRAGIVLFMVAYLAVFARSGAQAFIYFQF
jgi:D-alanyl-lipoteichoic acid acyltransferase DltB (MBOAT superfamily)